MIDKCKYCGATIPNDGIGDCPNNFENVITGEKGTCPAPKIKVIKQSDTITIPRWYYESIQEEAKAFRDEHPSLYEGALK